MKLVSPTLCYMSKKMRNDGRLSHIKTGNATVNVATYFMEIKYV